MIVSTPVILPYFEPDDWQHWWSLWSQHAKPLTKEGKSPNSNVGQWVGFDCMVSYGFYTVYKAPVVDLEEVYPSMHKRLSLILQGYHILGVRFVQSQAAFPAHKDNFMPAWQLRCLMSPTDPGQWYYERKDRTDRKHLRLPVATNWWTYLDGECLHGTEFNPDAKKILMQVYAHQKTFKDLAEYSMTKFDPEYQVAYD